MAVVQQILWKTTSLRVLAALRNLLTPVPLFRRATALCSRSSPTLRRWSWSDLNLNDAISYTSITQPEELDQTKNGEANDLIFHTASHCTVPTPCTTSSVREVMYDK